MGGGSRYPSYTGWSDDDLFAIVQQRRRTSRSGPDRLVALEILFERHHARVHAQCARLLGDEHLADDATQEVFLSLLARVIRYESRRHFGSWLYVVVRNYCFNLRRRRRKEVAFDPDWGEILLDAQDPNADAEQQEIASLVRQVCEDKLTPVEQQVLHLRFSWGMPVKQISEVLDLQNVSGARTHLATAKRKIRDELVERLGEATIRELFAEA